MRSSRPTRYTRLLHAHFLAIVPGNYRIVLQRSQLRNLAHTYLADARKSSGLLQFLTRNIQEIKR